MKLSDFDFELPEGAIARYPTDRRDASRLMVLDRQKGTIAHRQFTDLPELLAPGDLLVVNDSKVLKARLFLKKDTGGRVELLLVEPLEDGRWRAMARSSKPMRPGLSLRFTDEPESLATIESVEGDGFVTVSLPEDGVRLSERLGHLPLPPYLDRDAEDADLERYQTVYANADSLGSVAAPTAGLHFTEDVFRRLEARGVARTSLTLHVGPGTFLPVRAERIEDHQMHSEAFSVSEPAAKAINETKRRGGRVVAVGTTTVRTLESFDGPIEARSGRTDIFIKPGRAFRVVDAMVTNFHLPRSTLLMLVSAMAGQERILDAYRQAVDAGYRFFSYGDAMVIL